MNNKSAITLWSENVQWFPHYTKVPPRSILLYEESTLQQLPHPLPFLFPKSLPSNRILLAVPRSATIFPTGLPLQVLFLLFVVTFTHIIAQQTFIYVSTPNQVSPLHEALLF